jgi:hypothetical protein
MEGGEVRDLSDRRDLAIPSQHTSTTHDPPPPLSPEREAEIRRRSRAGASVSSAHSRDLLAEIDRLRAERDGWKALAGELAEAHTASVTDAYNLMTQGGTRDRRPPARRIYDRSLAALASYDEKAGA